MPRRAKGPRLYLQPARRRRDGTLEPSVWCIRDGKIKRSTGIGDVQAGSPPQAAIDFLTEYLNARKTPRYRDRDPAVIPIADVVAIYAEDVAPKHARPEETAARLKHILRHFAGRTLSFLNMATCQAYAKARGHDASARRELEDLRAAIRHHWKSGLCSALTPVVLPDKAEPRERWLTREEAARLLWAAWRRPRAKHVARFILVGLYTGTRSGAILGAAMAPTEGRGWVDTNHGVFYRRAIGKKRTNKRQPSIRIPPRLLSHVRRWHQLNQSRESLIEWRGQPVQRIAQAFRRLAQSLGMRDVSPHILRHTAITWQAQAGVPPHEICGFFGITMPIFENVYGHHHPDFQSNAVNALNRSPRQQSDRMNATKREQKPSNVVKISGF